MYVDYRIINEKEIEAINDRGEIIKITGLIQEISKRLYYYLIKLKD